MGINCNEWRDNLRIEPNKPRTTGKDASKEVPIIPENEENENGTYTERISSQAYAAGVRSTKQHGLIRELRGTKGAYNERNQSRRRQSGSTGRYACRHHRRKIQ